MITYCGEPIHDGMPLDRAAALSEEIRAAIEADRLSDMSWLRMLALYELSRIQRAAQARQEGKQAVRDGRWNSDEGER